MPISFKPSATVRWAILEGLYPEDIARTTRESLNVFLADPSLYDCPGLRGPAKRAELILKLGYWLALGRITPDDFRSWLQRIPPDDNEGWDADLVPVRPGCGLAQVLRVGSFATPSPAEAGG